ncbi:response regulator [Halorussus litoreus]|uniref:response regulator n=1 Tax=Halorussus litoreus TaxID=1710536 RepID=UPI000E240425|nr:response regulator [Halorussus litoreus]
MASAHPRVLHVDADADFAGVAARTLDGEYDMNVTTVDRGEAALEAVEREQFDCVVSEYDLPDGDGLELLDALRAIDAEIPFVLLTGKGSERVASDAISAGVADYLPKSDGESTAGERDQFAVLADAIDNAIARRQSERLADRQTTVNELLWDVSQTILGASSQEVIERTVCERLADSEPYVSAWIGKVDEDARAVRPQAVAGIGRRYLGPVLLDDNRAGRDRVPVRDAAETRSIQIAQGLDPGESFRMQGGESSRIEGGEGFETDGAVDDGYAAAAVPLAYGTRDYGVLSVWSDARYAFGANERRVLSKFGDCIASAIESVQTHEELVGREQRLQVFNRILRHNLRNDLNVVIGRAENVIEEFPPAGREAEVIKQKASDLIEISEKAREVGKTLDGGPRATAQIDVVDCVERTCSEFRQSCSDAEILIDTPDSATVYADKTLGAAISEVVENAVEHNDDPTVRVGVSTSDDGEWVDVTVLDDGPGIPETEREVLAEGEETSLQHGSGLGLWLTNWIVGKFGGQVSFDDYRTDGSAVTIRLRRATDEDASPRSVSVLDRE